MQAVEKYKLKRPTLQRIESALDLCLACSRASGAELHYLLSETLLTIVEPRTPWLKLRARFWRLPTRHFDLINIFLRKIGLLKGENSDEVHNPDEIKDRFNEHIRTIAAKMNKNTFEIKQNCTVDDFAAESLQVLSEQNNHFRRMTFAAHAPKAASEEIEKQTRQLKMAVQRLKTKLREDRLSLSDKLPGIVEKATEQVKGKVLPFKPRKAINFSQV